MKRGCLVTVKLPGDYGKPTPALVVRSDFFEAHPSLTVLPITSDLIPAPLCRITVGPSESTGLTKSSQIMVDKVQTVSKKRIGKVIGSVDDTALLEVNRALAVFLGIV